MRLGPDARLGAVFIIYRSEGDLCESRSASDRLLLRRWSALPRSGRYLCLSRIFRDSTHPPLSSGSEHPWQSLSASPAQLDSWPLSQFSRCLYLQTELAVQSVVSSLLWGWLAKCCKYWSGVSGVGGHAMVLMVSISYRRPSDVWIQCSDWSDKKILGSDWSRLSWCCNDDGHQSMPRVRSVRISKNMIITLSTGLGIHRDDGKIWNVPQNIQNLHDYTLHDSSSIIPINT